MAYSVIFRFYGHLNDLVPEPFRARAHRIDIKARRSVKDAVEGFGIPHVEVARLRVNGEDVGWERVLERDERVDVYPPSLSLVPEDGATLWTRPPEPVLFVADVHLGRLAHYLRMLGFDTVYETPDPGDPQLLATALKEDRVLLSQDRHLLMHGSLQHGCLLRSRDPIEQMKELIARYGLARTARPFSRCMECNTVLTKPEPTLLDQLPDKVQERYRNKPEALRYCPTCARAYWPGSHWDRMIGYLREWGVALS
ncbi:twitching motility protein PilT [bacterium]|nr:twitching motility protein PilT [bacterium]